MVKRKQYDDSRFHFVVTTDPYTAPSKDVQTCIRRQAMKDAGIQRRMRNKQKKDLQRQTSTTSPSSASSPDSHHEDASAPYIKRDASSQSPEAMQQSYDSLYSLGTITPPCSMWDGQEADEDIFLPDGGSDTQHALLGYPETNCALSIYRSDPFARYPVDLNPLTSHMLDYIYTTVSHGKFHNIRKWWLDAALEDPAMFHQKLAISAIHLGSQKGEAGKKDLALGVAFNNMAIADLNRRLCGPEKHSDGVLSTIIGLAYQNLDPRFVQRGWWIHLSSPESWASHVKAAHSIVDARGGIDKLNASPAVRQELYWIDLISASDLDIRPRYPLPETHAAIIERVLQQAQATVHRCGVRCDFPCQMYCSGDLDDLEYALLPLHDMKVIIAANRLNCERYRIDPWSDGDSTVDWLNPMTHRLQSLAPAHTSSDDRTNLGEAIRLATILYTYALRALPGTKQAPSTRQELQLKAMLERSSDMWTTAPLLKLWVMAVLTLSGNTETTLSWLCTMMRDIAQSMNIFTSGDLIETLKRVAWEKEFSRVGLDAIWTTPREIVEIPEDQSFPPTYSTYTSSYGSSLR